MGTGDKNLALTIIINNDIGLSIQGAVFATFWVAQHLNSDVYASLAEVGDTKTIRVNAHVFHRLVAHAVMADEPVAVRGICDDDDVAAIAIIGPSATRAASLDAAIAQAAKDYPVSPAVRSRTAP